MSENDRASKELLALIEAALNGDLTSSDCARLETILAADPEARRLYIRSTALDADLWLGAGSAGRACRVRGPRRRAAFAAAALVLLTVSVATLSLVGPRVWGSEPAARLARSVDAKWGGEGIDPRDPKLLSGQSLRLDAGIAEVAFDCGARAILEAPAALEVDSARACRLHAGRMTVTVPGDAKGFAVRTRVATVVDVGTEFGVEVDGRGATEVHVFRGEVDVEPATGESGEGSAARTNLRVRQGEALRIAPGGSETIPADAPRFLRNEKLTPKTERILLKDDFSADRLDAGTWRIVVPVNDSSFGLDGGRAKLVNRAYLVTEREFDPLALGGVRISGTWRFVPEPEDEGNARVDILSIMTRSDARVGDPYYEVRSGIEFRLLSSERIPRIRALGPDLAVTRTATRGELHVEDGDLLEFEAIDDGRDLSFTVRKAGDPANAVTAAATVTRDATRRRLIVIHNRENPHKQRHISYLDDVVIAGGVGPCPR